MNGGNRCPKLFHYPSIMLAHSCGERASISTAEALQKRTLLTTSGELIKQDQYAADAGSAQQALHIYTAHRVAGCPSSRLIICFNVQLQMGPLVEVTMCHYL